MFSLSNKLARFNLISINLQVKNSEDPDQLASLHVKYVLRLLGKLLIHQYMFVSRHT